MKKLLVCALTAAMSFTALAGCGSNTNETTTSTTPAADAEAPAADAEAPAADAEAPAADADAEAAAPTEVTDVALTVTDDMFIDKTYIIIKRGKKNYYIGRK